MEVIRTIKSADGNSDINVYEGERIDGINDSLRLIQKNDGLTFGTDAYLLYAFMRRNTKVPVGEFGAGTGIISLLCANSKKFLDIVDFEIQEDFVDIINRNVRLNSLDKFIKARSADIRELKECSFKVIFSNPPYMKADSGKGNDSSYKNIARRELCGDIFDFCQSASRCLTYSGMFYCVYRADRSVDLFDAMRKSSIEPKRITYVHPDKNSRPSLVLVEGKKGAASGVYVTMPLIMHEDASAKVLVDTPDMQYIYSHGEFNAKYYNP